VAPLPSSLPVALPREGVSSAYGVQGLAPAGNGSSPRWAIQMRSGVSANTAPTEPHVQPSCLTPSGPSGSGCGQFSTGSYGPNSSCPPLSAAAGVTVAAPPRVLEEEVQPARITAQTDNTRPRTRIVFSLWTAAATALGASSVQQ